MSVMRDERGTAPVSVKDGAEFSPNSFGAGSTPDVSARPLWRTLLLPVFVPLMLVAVILQADLLEGPKTAYVGVLAVVPMLSAVFGTPLQTGIVSVAAWGSAFAFGHVASDGNVMAQQVRLIIIAISGVTAVLAARHRMRREHALKEAERSRALVEQMRHDATTDLLTGIPNRRGLLMELEDFDRTAPITLAIADCDKFKKVNDRLGHLAGDRYLRETARRLQRALSDTDLVGRWGGDEFLVALPLAPAEAALVLERVAGQVARKISHDAEELLCLSLTFGVAEWHPGEPIDNVLLRADRAMLNGKRTSSRVHIDAS